LVAACNPDVADDQTLLTLLVLVSGFLVPMRPVSGFKSGLELDFDKKKRKAGNQTRN
jgi:hypothetical protein